MGDTLDRVPGHLRRFVVQQDYGAYTAIDHAVWRFVLLQMFARLRHSAHPAYGKGLTQTGMSVERIPRIAEMDACLGNFGWGAVCVDGFIPPRAFQEFQALGILPIAADMRRLENLAYTPAPDIIHEAAGHAPILPDPEYATFLRGISECGMRAFGSRRDQALYEAVRQLSIVKEQRDASPHEVQQAEQGLAALMAQSEAPSEATRLARLYWWTVEYGLVGRPDDYKLYGAGLLSSLAESHFCHDARVRKLSLTPDVVHCDYDITQQQPQLFVARDFAHLLEVLDRACADCAFRVGGLRALGIARDSGELASVELESGLELIGSVAAFTNEGDRPLLVELSGTCALADGGGVLTTPSTGGRAIYPLGLRVAFARHFEQQASRAAPGARLDLELSAGMRARGTVRELLRSSSGVLAAVVLEGAQVSSDTASPHAVDDRVLAVIGASAVRAVRAGVRDTSYWPAQAYPECSVPRSEPEDAAQRDLRTLYETEANQRPQASASSIAALHERLNAHPVDWLLRWNLLQRLAQLDADPARRTRLSDELWQLELHHDRKHPIATGLRYLGYRVH